MCAHVTIVTWDELLAVARAMYTHTPVNELPDWPARQPHYTDAFPKSLVPLLLSTASGSLAAKVTDGAFNGKADKSGVFELSGSLVQPAMLAWGYPLTGKSDVVFNTRVETAAKSSLWRNSFENRHCVIPVHAFFEPHKAERAINAFGKEVKQVYRFEEAVEPVMLLAGIWENDRFSILTTEPNAYVSPVHPRMPVVLNQQSAISWLTFQGLNVREDIPLTSSPFYDAESPGSGSISGQQLTLF